MGAQMARELGVYNEEEKVHTPSKIHTPSKVLTPPQRYRLLNKDPRSASLGITRTPIQVECSPLSSDQLHHSVEEISTLEENIQNKEGEIDSFFKEEKDNSSKHECEDISFKTELKYLETDIDQLDSSKQLAHNTTEKSLVELADVRSPSFQITRTPILVECTPELFALHSQIENLSFCDVDVHEDDPSALVSEDDQSNHHNQSSINNWLTRVENMACDTPITDKSISESPRQVARKQKELNVLKKQLFFTPNIKETAKPKVRTPLGDLQAGQLQLESPQKLVRAKQWRNIQEERKRRGIFDTENTPPNLPPLSKISSAPGKIVDRKRNKINWDEENTLLI